MALTTLVLDGDQRSALASVRSLGRAGVPVLVAESHAMCLAGASRHSIASLVYPSPHTEPDRFVQALCAMARERDVRVLLPMTDVTTRLIIEHRGRLGSNIGLALPSSRAYSMLTDKASLFQVAGSLGLPTPATASINSMVDLASALAKVKPPYVLKPSQSKVWLNEKWTSTSVQYAETDSVLRRALADSPFLGKVPLLLQHRVVGEGQGVFALYDRGSPLVWFSHRRIREKPPSGGVSVLSESVPVNPLMEGIAERLLTHVGWHGIAMVEFKVERDGTPYIIEVNGRPWGSMQLAVDAGMDFPLLLHRLALGEHPEVTRAFQEGIRCRWLLGDLDHLYLVWKAPPEHYPFSAKLRTLWRFLLPTSARTRFEVNRLDDIRPFWRELRRFFGK